MLQLIACTRPRTPSIYTLSLHDALPISATETFVGQWPVTPGSGPWDLAFSNGQIWFTEHFGAAVGRFDPVTHAHQDFPDRKSTRLNSSHLGISYAVFCLKKKKK